MVKRMSLGAGVAVLCILPLGVSQKAFASQAMQPQRERLIQALKEVHKLDDQRMEKLKKIFRDSPFLGQGNTAITAHPFSQEECSKKLAEEKIDYRNPNYDTICKAPFMAPLYDPAKQKAADAKICIDQFEFPDIPCEYPVIWVKAREAVLICEAMGKRLCDAHEWEGACAGKLQDPDYHFELLSGSMSDNQKQQALRRAHNRTREVTWSYGPTKNHGLCATKSQKSPGCDQANRTGKGVWQNCGSNTYPVGAFPQCKSNLDVYDIHGNAAEHMNLPLSPQQSARMGKYGVTEMKGSWFIFSKVEAHEDDCRWRAPYWHGSAVMSGHSHYNYHLGFRCCKDIE